MPYSILIVEDDLTFATMLKTWLGKKGFLVDTAGNSARARKQLDAQSYNLVLSDLRLPETKLLLQLLPALLRPYQLLHHPIFWKVKVKQHANYIIM